MNAALPKSVSAHLAAWVAQLKPEHLDAAVEHAAIDTVIDVLDKLFGDGRNFVCGDRFTATDVYLGSQIDWGLQFDTIPERDSFKAYAGRLRERAAYKRAKSIDNGLIAEMKAKQEQPA